MRVARQTKNEEWTEMSRGQLVSKVMRPLVWLGVAGAMLLLVACSGTRPTSLGSVDGRLGTCPASPNCVTSNPIEAADDSHSVAALRVSGDPLVAWRELVLLLESTPRVRIVSQESDYLHAEFTSPLMRYVDDVEFMQDREDRAIAVRSASRVGHSDMGANRRRVEWIRESLVRRGVVVPRWTDPGEMPR